MDGRMDERMEGRELDEGEIRIDEKRNGERSGQRSGLRIDFW